MSENREQYKCGICNWAIEVYCDNLLDHQCFAHFNEDSDHLVVDENAVVHIVPQSPETEAVSSQAESVSIEASVGEESQENVWRVRWTHNAILMLIHYYQQHIKEFMSTTEKKDKVWGRISEELISKGFHYTPNQCKFNEEASDITNVSADAVVGTQVVHTALETPPKAKVTLGHVLQEIRAQSLVREEHRAVRHEQNMKMKQKLLDAFTSKMDALVNTKK